MNKVVTILSIDPGTSSTGTSILQVDTNGEVSVQYVETINAPRLLSSYRHVAHVHGDRFARIMATGEQLQRLMHIHQPNFIVSESPYMGRFATSFAALTELITEIRRQVYIYDPSMPLDLLEPSVVKTYMGVDGRSGDKDLMQEAVLNKALLYSENTINPTALDEHSIDAIAVGLCFIGRLF